MSMITIRRLKRVRALNAYTELVFYVIYIKLD